MYWFDGGLKPDVNSESQTVPPLASGEDGL